MSKKKDTSQHGFKLSGGSVVRTKSGEVVTIYDLHNRYIIGMDGFWYPYDDIEEVLS